jgi:hypothetical protein
MASWHMKSARLDTRKKLLNVFGVDLCHALVH